MQVFPTHRHRRMGNLWFLLSIFLTINRGDTKATIFQEQYHLIENCDNYAPPSSSIFSTQTMENIFRCVKQCQINLACQSFAYKSQTSECLLSRKNVSTCDDLEANSGSKSYKVIYSCIIPYHSSESVIVRTW